jgi:hypothetical protein
VATGPKRAALAGLASSIALASLLVGGAFASSPVPHFATPQIYAEDGGYDPVGIALADMNRDGRNDLVTVNSGDEVTIRDGKKSGGFGQPQTFPVGSGRDYYGLAVARINADKRPDIAVTNSNDDTITVLLARRDGGFADRSFDPDPATPGYPADLVAADFNGDGKQDLAVADGNSGAIWVLLGTGDGHFKAPRTATASVSETIQIVTGNFNGDRRPDLAVATSTTNADVLLNRGHGRFRALPPLDFGPNTDTYGIASGRLNHDKTSDLAIAVENFNTAPSPDYVAALTATGGGHFQERDIDDGEAANVIGIGIGELNGDGVPDIATARYDLGDVTVLAGTGGGHFAAPVSVGSVGSPTALTAGRVDANRSTDLAVGAAASVAILRNNRTR